jgi:phage regulator Rha-like protein
MNDMISITLNQNIRMTSQEIADLTEKRHDNVKRTIETLAESGVIRLPQIEDSEIINNLGLPAKVKLYVFDLTHKRDSFVVVAQLSPEFTARLVDRWQQLEAQQAPALPRTYVEALRELLSAVEAREQAEERARIAESTKAQIGSRREATAMAAASVATQKVKRLEAELDKSPEYATVKRMNEIHDGKLLELSSTRAKNLSVLGKRLKAESILLKIPSTG